MKSYTQSRDFSSAQAQLLLQTARKRIWFRIPAIIRQRAPALQLRAHQFYTVNAALRGEHTDMHTTRIILVDDEKDFVETLAKRLRHRGGFDVDFTYTGEDALEKIRECEYDIAIIDVKMPGMDGLETLVEIKKMRPDLRVIFLTGHASMETGEQGKSKGAFDYMTKPVEFNELMDKIHAALGHKD
jgi:CheY-like chemotaxis protein